MSAWPCADAATIAVRMMPMSRLKEKLSKVPMKVRRATRTGMPYQCGERAWGAESAGFEVVP
jgi:hypothetical protein